MKHLAILIVLAGICFGTVTTTTSKTGPTVGNGSTVAFVFSFSYTATSEIVVTSRVSLCTKSSSYPDARTCT